MSRALTDGDKGFKQQFSTSTDEFRMYSLVDTGISECGALCFNKIVKSSVDVGNV